MPNSKTNEAYHALMRLKEGNKRFVQNVRSIDVLASQGRRQDLVSAQNPFAIILSCSDSRAPAEILFDQGLGDLFVIRVAGNIIAPSLVGSVEFAAAAFGTPLVVVMGHSRCGAISATLDVIQGKSQVPSENIADIVERIRPSVQNLVQPLTPPKQLMHQAIRANIQASVDHLRHGSHILESLIQAGKLQIIGAEYLLETGEVVFFEGVESMEERKATAS